MSKSVEFFFDVGSPTVYLAATQLSKIAGRHGATVLWRPFLLGGVFKATGNVVRQRYRQSHGTGVTIWSVLRDATKYHSFLIHFFR
ncbi:MAG: hypothetical protein CM1200mP41_18630 [Gammaproteobacteria bacterium]|nr:MAG: hypothetical protein CM1200mP41_18630 [Gammaproteobacteria bacterium]